jgi:hypothetical protein
VYLNHGPPGTFFVLELRLTAYTDDTGIVGSGSYQSIQRVRIDRLKYSLGKCINGAGTKAYCVGINSEDILVERGVDPNDIAHLVVDF